jgi:hypothetical protein
VTWLSKAAVLWALDDAPDVPAHLVAALVAVARYTGEDGRGAYPSVATIAAHIRKSERGAKRDLAELHKLGLLLPGDLRIVKDIRADRRPGVYDLPMPRGDAGVTPPDGHGVTPMTARGDTHGRHGVTPASPEDLLKKSGTRGRAGASAPPWCGQCHKATRLTDEDAPRRCPACHPLVAGRPSTPDQQRSGSRDGGTDGCPDRATCTVCGGQLDQVLIAAGLTDHGEDARP